MPLDKSHIQTILTPATIEARTRQEDKVRASFFETLKRAARQLPFAEDVVASYYCAVDPETPSSSKGILLAALAYFVLPIDIVPDFLLGIGFTDDIAVLWAAFRTVQNTIKPEHYVKARARLHGTRAP